MNLHENWLYWHCIDWRILHHVYEIVASNSKQKAFSRTSSCCLGLKRMLFLRFFLALLIITYYCPDQCTKPYRIHQSRLSSNTSRVLGHPINPRLPCERLWRKTKKPNHPKVTWKQSLFSSQSSCVVSRWRIQKGNTVQKNTNLTSIRGNPLFCFLTPIATSSSAFYPSIYSLQLYCLYDWK